MKRQTVSPPADALDVHGSLGVTAVRAERGEAAEEARNETDAEGRVIGQRRGHRVGILGRYLARNQITSRQHDAGQRFVAIWEASCRTARVVADLVERTSGGGSDISVALYRIARSRMSARRQHDAAVAILGPTYPLVADVLLAHGEPKAWAVRRKLDPNSGFAILVLALDALADHYQQE